MNTSMFSFWTDRKDPLHYWKLIIAGWCMALLGAFPAQSMVRESDLLWAFSVLLALPALAHLYGFIANIKTIRNPESAGEIGPALVGVSYILAVVIGLTQIGVLPAITLPFTAVMIAVLTLGDFFTGFAPLLGMVLLYFLLQLGFDRTNMFAATIIMTSAWLLSMAAGWSLANL